MICVTFALPEESGDLRRALAHRRYLERGRLPVIAGFRNDIEVVVGHTGIGFDSCRLHTEKLLVHAPPRILISSGFAGGLDPGVRTNDVVLSESFSDPELLKNARTSLRGDRRVFVGSTASKPLLFETAEDKRALAQQTRALAVDMETAVIAELCRDDAIPMLSMRGISDSVRTSLPIPFTVWFDMVHQKPRPFPLMMHLLRNPHAISPFTHFVRQLRNTRAHLTRCLIHVIEGLH